MDLSIEESLQQSSHDLMGIKVQGLSGHLFIRKKIAKHTLTPYSSSTRPSIYKQLLDIERSVHSINYLYAHILFVRS